MSGDAWILYAVTARHVVQNIRALGLEKVYLRSNLKDGTCAWFDLDLEDWFYDSSSPTLDICAALIGPVPEMDFKWVEVPDHSFTPSVSPGEPVYFPGLFSERPGIAKNIPIVRTGTIAALPEESLKTGVGGIEAYLIEARSIGGHSGSPVFLNQNGTLTLLGIVHGHFRGRSNEGTEGEKSDNWINFGIAIVIPIQLVSRFFDCKQKKRFALNE